MRWASTFVTSTGTTLSVPSACSAAGCWRGRIKLLEQEPVDGHDALHLRLNADITDLWVDWMKPARQLRGV